MVLISIEAADFSYWCLDEQVEQEDARAAEPNDGDDAGDALPRARLRIRAMRPERSDRLLPDSDGTFLSAAPQRF